MRQSAWTSRVVVATLATLPFVGATFAHAVDKAPAEDAEALVKQLDKLLKEVPGADPRPAATAPSAVKPATAPLDFMGLVPGQSSRVDVDFQLGDPIETIGARLVYAPPAGPPAADRVEAVFVKDTRVLYWLDVRLATPLGYADAARLGGRRVLVEKDDAGRTWEYHIPGFLALGYPATVDGPPRVVQELRYASPQLLADRFVTRGRKAEEDKRWDDALTEFEKATRIDPTYALGYLKMGTAWEGKGDRKQALLHYTAAAQAAYPADVRANAHYLAGVVYYDDHQPELALKAFGRTLATNPGHARAQFHVGLTYHSQLKNPGEALAAYQRAVALKPDYDVAHYNIGLIHQDARDFRLAAAAFAKAVQHAPAWIKASHQLLAVTLQLGDFAGVEREARRRLAVQSDDTVAMVHLAMALSGQLPERSTVVAFLTNAVTEDARLAEALEWLDRAVTSGYADRKVLEQSTHLQKTREQGPLAFKKILAKLDKRG